MHHDHFVSPVAQSEDNDIIQLPRRELEPHNVLTRACFEMALASAAQSGRQRLDWGHGVLNLAETRARHRVTGDGVTVAVLDTGVDLDHPDLVANIAGHHDFTQSRVGANDVQGHGTHCAGIIAASDNDIGFVGVAPLAKIYAVKVLGDTGSGSVYNIAKGISHAVVAGCEVISMSLGGSGEISRPMREAILNAIERGTIVVVAAGNEGPSDGTVGAPGNFIPCVTVGAIDRDRTIASFSSRGTQLDVAAPGVNIYSTYPGARYTELSGTSMATPYVAGIAALFVQLAKRLGVRVNQKMFEDYAKATAIDLGPRGHDTMFGAGLINPMGLLDRFVLDNRPPPPPPVPLPDPIPVPLPDPLPVPSVGFTATIVLTSGRVMTVRDIRSFSIEASPQG